MRPDPGSHTALPWFSYGSTLVLTEARLVLSPNSGSKACRWSSLRPLCSSTLCLTCQHSGATYPGRPPGLLFAFGLLPCFFFHTHSSLDPPSMHVQPFPHVDPTTEACGMGPHFLWDGATSFFQPQVALLPMCREGSFPCPQDWAFYLFTPAGLSFCH